MPAAMRRRLGIDRANSVVIVEEREDGLFLRLAVALRTGNLTKRQIERWVSRDKTEMAAFHTGDRQVRDVSGADREQIPGN